MAKVYLAIGSNLGDKEKNCREAIDLLKDDRGIEVISVSSLYITEPVGGPPQENYLNGVLEVETTLSPQKLIITLKDMEKKMGRVISEEKNNPRIIDIDILFYEDFVVEGENLKIPHPRMHERAFVLKGFAEIGPEVVHPVLKKTVGELYENLGHSS